VKRTTLRPPLDFCRRRNNRMKSTGLATTVS